MRSVFEVANLALNKLHFGQWGDTEKELLYKAKLDKYSGNEDGEENTQDDILDNFIVKGFEFVYGADATMSVESVATSVNGEAVMPTLVLPEKEKSIDLPLHVNYEMDDAAVATVSNNGELQGLARGQSTMTASIGGVINVETQVSVLKDTTELALYKNSGKADFFAVDGQISLVGGFYNTSSNNTEKVGTSSGSVGYVAFEDTYTLDERGTYIDIYFTGNNMPSVEFFASEVNEKFMLGYSDDGKGFIVNNGMAYSSTNEDNSTARFNGWAAYDGYFNYGVSGYNNRWNGADAYKLGAQATSDGKATIYDNKNSRETTVNYSNFSMYSLAQLQDANQNYRYTVGMYKDSDGYVWLDSKLFKVASDGTETAFAEWKGKAIIEGQTNSVKQDKLNEGEVISGKIVLHAAVKGMPKGKNTPDANVFACSAPYAGEEPFVIPQHENATFNEDGTVSVKNGNTNSQTLTNATSGYVVLDEGYQLGEYVDIYFTGDNMPWLSFFAAEATNRLHNSGSGFVMINGLGYADSTDSTKYVLMGLSSGAAYGYELMIFAPNRGAATKIDTNMLLGRAISSSKNQTQRQELANPLSMYKLSTMPDTQFKMTIGFYENASGKVEMSIYVAKYENDAWVKYYELTKASSLSATTDAGKLGNYLIAYGNQRNAYTTITFSYSKPYTK